ESVGLTGCEPLRFTAVPSSSTLTAFSDVQLRLEDCPLSIEVGEAFSVTVGAGASAAGGAGGGGGGAAFLPQAAMPKLSRKTEATAATSDRLDGCCDSMFVIPPWWYLLSSVGR